MVSENMTLEEAWNKLRSAMLYRRWEVPILVLISVTFQVVLVLLSNHRRHSKSRLLIAVLWSAYMAANAVATLALSIISTNLTVAEVFNSTLEPYDLRIHHKSTLPLDPRIELQTFWAPFFLLHLGGPDTITAFGVEDNDLWQRHLLSLVVQTSLTLFILFTARTHSSLTALSAMMFAAGSIKYAERTWSLWSASYKRRRQEAAKALNKRIDEEERYHVDVTEQMRHGDVNIDVELARTATVMFLDTKHMFADAFMNHELKRYKQIVLNSTSRKVMRLVEIELEMMYDNLYTKARVILSYTGLALRFISFLLTCITLILFSSSERRERHFRGITEYSLTFLLFGIATGLELYAAFIFLTMYRTISWFKEHKMNGAARIMEYLAKLRTRDWSNSMGQFSEIRYFMQPKGPFFMRGILPRSSIMWLNVYHRRVPHELKHLIHQYLKEASWSKDKYSQQQLLFVQSKGRVPWKQYINNEQHDRMDRQFSEDASASSLCDKEFTEIIIFLHLVTEVCYYLDRSTEYDYILRLSRFSKYLSRYLMHLFVVSSDLLPQRTPLSKRRLYKDINPLWRPFFTRHRHFVKAQKKKENRKAAKMLWENTYIGNTSDISALRFAHNLLTVLRADVPSPPEAIRRWEVLWAVWVELLVYAADQCKGKAHAQHLTSGGELLTHVWVLLGHFGFIDEAILPSTLQFLKGYDDEPPNLYRDV